MRDRSQRARGYEIVLREGGPEDVFTYIDGVLLIDLWDGLVLPRDIRDAWAPVVESAVQTAVIMIIVRRQRSRDPGEHRGALRCWHPA